MLERQIHRQVVDYLRIALPADALFSHVPNEGKRGFNAQRDFKQLGSMTGWPDLQIIWRGRIYCLELKAPRKFATPEQRACHAKLKDAGVDVAICRSVVEVEMSLQKFGIPLNARIAA